MSDAAVKVASDDAPFPLTDVDRWVLSLTDEEYHYHDWEEMKQIIGENNLSVLKRKPSDLRRYMKWTAETKAEYGSMTNYLIKHRLPQTWGTPPFIPASTVPFDNPSDYRVLTNDWPYGLTQNMTHIVVWSRTPIETDPETGDMTPESRRNVTNFVKKFFVDRIGLDGEDRVLWFKNWVALQSVRALERMYSSFRSMRDTFEETSNSEGALGISYGVVANIDIVDIHVIVKDADKTILDEWTRELNCHKLPN